MQCIENKYTDDYVKVLNSNRAKMHALNDKHYNPKSLNH